MQLTFLGTGTSQGVPVIGCNCPVCQSADPRDRRTRCSALVETQGRTLLIDAGPDMRTQMLRAVMPADQVDAMVAAGPARRGYDPKSRPVMQLLQELTKRKDLSSVVIEKPGLRLELNGGAQ